MIGTGTTLSLVAGLCVSPRIDKSKHLPNSVGYEFPLAAFDLALKSRMLLVQKKKFDIPKLLAPESVGPIHGESKTRCHCSWDSPVSYDFDDEGTWISMSLR
jgi:hypothetical protein